MNEHAIDCTICRRGTRLRRLTRRHGSFAAVLGLLLLVAGALGCGLGLLAMLASFGERNGRVLAFTVAAPLMVGGMLVMLVGALASRKKSVLWCEECWATTDCVDAGEIEVPLTDPGSELVDKSLPEPGAELQSPSANPGG